MIFVNRMIYSFLILFISYIDYDGILPKARQYVFSALASF